MTGDVGKSTFDWHHVSNLVRASHDRITSPPKTDFHNLARIMQTHSVSESFRCDALKQRGVAPLKIVGGQHAGVAWVEESEKEAKR
jgi:hypothetical protein